MGDNPRNLACFHCGSEDKLIPHEHCTCDGEGMVHTPGFDEPFVACGECDYHCCAECFEWLNPICTEPEGLDHE